MQPNGSASGQHRDIIRVLESVKNLSGKNSLNVAKASGEHCLSIKADLQSAARERRQYDLL